jgi:hypothetical protein
VCDQIFVDGVACGDHAIEQRGPEGGQQYVGVGVCWQLTPFDRCGDDRGCAFGLLAEVASGCLAQLSRSHAGCEDQRDNLAPDASVQHLSQLLAEREQVGFDAAGVRVREGFE